MGLLYLYLTKIYTYLIPDISV
jgi:hypothetical protein